jgi:hypothetical protein
MMVLKFGFPISTFWLKIMHGSFEIEILDSIPPLSDPLIISGRQIDNHAAPFCLSVGRGVGRYITAWGGVANVYRLDRDLNQ